MLDAGFPTGSRFAYCSHVEGYTSLTDPLVQEAHQKELSALQQQIDELDEAGGANGAGMIQQKVDVPQMGSAPPRKNELLMAPQLKAMPSQVAPAVRSMEAPQLMAFPGQSAPVHIMEAEEVVEQPLLDS